MAAEHDQMPVKEEEYLDVLTKTGEKTGISKPRYQSHIKKEKKIIWVMPNFDQFFISY